MNAVAIQDAAETDRLAALEACEILDTPPEPEFDFLARLAAEVCGTEMSGVSFVDGVRRFYKSAIGHDPTDVPRDQSFCAHTVSSGSSLIVNDALADARFSDNPLVTDAPQVRFYAGAPLRTRDGQVLGALSVMGTEPRELAPHQLELLEGLAGQVVKLVEQNRDAGELRRARRRLNQDESLAHVAAWEWDPATDTATWTPELRMLLGVDDDVEGGIEAFMPLVHEGDRERVRETVKAAVDTGGRFAYRARILRPDGEMRTIDTQGEAELDQDGTAVSVWGATVDVTELVEAERRSREQAKGLSAAIETAQNAILVSNDERRYIQVNQASSELLGYTREELLSMHVDDIIPPPEPGEPDTGEMWESFVDAGHQRGEIAVVRADGSRAVVEYSATANFVPGRHLTILKDVTERRTVEREVLESRQLLEETQKLARVASWEWDLGSELQTMSPEVAEIMGLGTGPRRPDYEEFVNFIHPDDRAAFGKSLGQALRSAHPFRQIFRVVTAAGEVRTIEAHGRVKKDETDRPTHMFGAVQDITQRERAAHELRLQANVLDQMPASVIASDPDHKITHWNHGAELMFGIEREQAVGREFDDLGLVPPESVAVRKWMLDVLSEGKSWEGEIRICGAGERTFTALATNSPVHGEHGRVAGYVAVLVDLTERRSIEKEVGLQGHLLDQVEASVIALDPKLRITHWNEAAEKLYGWSREDAVGRPIGELNLVPADADGFREEIEAQARGGGSWEGEIEARRRDGTTLTVYSSNSALRDADGEPAGYVGVSVDMTDRKRAEQLAKAARLDTIKRLAIAVEKRDPETGTHIERIGQFAAMLAELLGMSPERARLIRVSSTMHDVGKVGIADSVLLKPGKLTPEERDVIETHCQIGRDILTGPDADLELAASIALSHHERIDGTGYPDGLRGTDIPLEGRIVAVADVFDALISDRVYRKAFSVEKAIEMMQEGRGSHFDPAILDLLVENLELFTSAPRGAAD